MKPTESFAPAPRARLALAAAGLLWAVCAQAQTPACELLKETLGARIDPAIRGHAIEAVRAREPVPRGAKVIGTCEGGAYKILFWRFGVPAARAAASGADATVAAKAAPMPALTPEATPQAMPAAKVPPKPEPKPEPKLEPKLEPKPEPKAESKLQPQPQPQPQIVPSVPAAAPPVVLAAVAPRVASAPALTHGPAAAPASAALAASASTSASAATPGLADTLAAPQAQVATEPPAAEDDSGLWALLLRHWPWIAAPVGLALLAWLWSVISYRMAYDEAGLPRGPRLN